MRVGIVNDQRLVTEALRRIVLSDPSHQVAWTAEDGREAVQFLVSIKQSLEDPGRLLLQV